MAKKDAIGVQFYQDILFRPLLVLLEHVRGKINRMKAA
jgi:hypothetical protein